MIASGWALGPPRTRGDGDSTLHEARKGFEGDNFTLSILEPREGATVWLTSQVDVRHVEETVRTLAPAMPALNETLLETLGPSPYAPRYFGGDVHCSEI